MKKIIKYILAIFLLILLQVSIINNGILFNFKANLLLVMTIYISHLYGSRSGTIFGLISGLIYDALLSPSIGLTSLALFIISFIVSHLRGYIFNENLFLYVFYVLIFNVLYYIIIYIIAFFISLPVTFSMFLSSIFSYINLNNIISVIILHIIYNYKNQVLAVFNLER